MNISLESMMQIENQVEKLYLQHQEQITKLKETAQQTKVEKQAESHKRVETFKENLQDASEQRLACYQDDKRVQHEAALQELERRINEKESVLLDRILEEVVTRYGRF